MESCSSPWILNRPKFHGATDFYIKAVLATCSASFMWRWRLLNKAPSHKRDWRRLVIEMPDSMEKCQDRKTRVVHHALTVPKELIKANASKRHSVACIDFVGHQLSLFYTHYSRLMRDARKRSSDTRDTTRRASCAPKDAATSVCNTVTQTALMAANRNQWVDKEELECLVYIVSCNRQWVDECSSTHDAFTRHVGIDHVFRNAHATIHIQHFSNTHGCHHG